MTLVNRNIEDLLTCGSMAIDAEYALNAYTNYLHELKLIENGSKFSDLGISERRHSQKMDVINPDGTRTSIETAKEGSIAVHKLSGVMRLQDSMSTRGIESLSNDILTADRNPNIKSHILEVNSGGGEALAGQELFNTISSLTKPLDTLAKYMGSAAVLGTLPSRKILAAGQIAKIGSIGAMVSFNKKELEEIKNNSVSIYADSSKDKNASFRALINGDESLVKEEISKTANIFMNMVASHRNIKDESTLNGGMFNGEEAVKRGLADGIGTLSDLLNTEESKMADKNTEPSKGFFALISKMFGKEVKTTEELNALAEDANSMQDVTKNLFDANTKAIEEKLNLAIQEANEKSSKDFDAKLSEALEKFKTEQGDSKDTELSDKYETLQKKFEALEDKQKANAKAILTGKFIDDKEEQSKAMSNPKGTSTYAALKDLANKGKKQ